MIVFMIELPCQINSPTCGGFILVVLEDYNSCCTRQESMLA